MAEKAADAQDLALDSTSICPNREDAAMAAAREELKHTVISEDARQSPGDEDPHKTNPTPCTSNDARIPRKSSLNDDNVRLRESHEDSPDTPPQQDLASPKKKRRHDQVDKDKEADDSDVHSESSAGSRDRTLRSEPEKKRPRDDVALACGFNESGLKAPKSPTTRDDGGLSTFKITSSEAFASSGFARLSSYQSPFGSLASTTQPSPFSSAAPTLSPFKLSISFTNSVSSPFVSLREAAPNDFKSGFGGFGEFGTLSSPSTSVLSTFAKPGEAFISDKPSKPFGAPESDSGGCDNQDDGSDADSSDDEADKSVRIEKVDEKDNDSKRLRLHKVDVDDGETGEITVLHVRAKMFYLDKVSGWKERGAGMLKINVPCCCVQFDAAGSLIPNSFDASELEADATKVPRLILRQDQTHRILLNTAILPATEFQEKPTLRATTVLFTAFEGDNAKPVSVTMKMSAANAKSFLAEISNIKLELRGG